MGAMKFKRHLEDIERAIEKGAVGAVDWTFDEKLSLLDGARRVP